METEMFWRERHARFRELAAVEGAHDLHAGRFEPVDLPALRDERAAMTIAAIENPNATPDTVYSHAWTTARAGRILLDGEQVDRWAVSGGPDDALARATLQDEFKVEAMMAAVGAGKAEAAATDQAALEAWLDLVIEDGNPHYRRFGGIERLAHASAEMCHQLAGRAYRSARSPTNPPAKESMRPVRLLKRASWLKTKMDADLGLTKNSIESQDGPDRKTITRILNGQPVTETVVKRLAKALRVHRDQIPND